MFIIFTLLAYLAVDSLISTFCATSSASYWPGLRIIAHRDGRRNHDGRLLQPLILNKLIDKTIYGAWFSRYRVFCHMAVNVIFNCCPLQLCGLRLGQFRGARHGHAPELFHGAEEIPHIDYPMEGNHDLCSAGGGALWRYDASQRLPANVGLGGC